MQELPDTYMQITVTRDRTFHIAGISCVAGQGPWVWISDATVQSDGNVGVGQPDFDPTITVGIVGLPAPCRGLRPGQFGS